MLIPSDELNLLTDVCAAYQRLGWKVVVGVNNFFLSTITPDLVHFLWPEELSGWVRPSDNDLSRINDRLHFWSQATKTLFSVNNLYPHGYEGDKTFNRLYKSFHERCEVILHHSRTSRELSIKEFQLGHHQKHIVTTMFAYDRLLNPAVDRQAARHSFNFANGDFVILVFGAIRRSVEVQLIQRGFAGSRIQSKRLLMGGRYVPQGGRWERLRRRIDWSFWLRRQNAALAHGFIPDDDVARYFTAANAVVIPRLNDMSSGIVGLGMSFGRLLIAPNHGAFPEYLSGTPNLLYQSGDPQSLASAIDLAAESNSRIVYEKNRERADQWTWDRVLKDGISALGQTA